MVLSYVFILIFGIITSISDCKQGKVKNHVLLIFFAIGLVSSTAHSIEYGLLFETYLNIVFAVVVGYLLYHTKVWAAGDGKLFTVYAVLVPLSQYKTTLFPSIYICVNTFLIAFVYLFIKEIKNLNFRKTFVSLKNIKNLAYISIAFFSIEYMSKGIIMFGVSQEITMFITIGLVLFLSKYKKHLYIGFGLVTLVRLIFDRSYLSSGWVFFFMFSVMIIHFIKSIIIAGFALKGSKKPSALKEGEIIAQDFMDINQGEKIDKKTINLIKKAKKTVLIYETIPFALFLFLGSLLTLVFRGWIF
jgi:Flp pilus assembly protein protease CpaA